MAVTQEQFASIMHIIGTKIADFALFGRFSVFRLAFICRMRYYKGVKERFYDD